RHEVHVERPGNQTYLDAGGGPLEGGLCLPPTQTAGCNLRIDQQPYNVSEWGIGTGFYAQDRWKPIKRLTILPGIRFDWGLTKNALGQTVTNLFGVGPRIGATVDITGDQKTIFRAFYGRANETLSLLPASDVAEFSAFQTTKQWDPVAKDFTKVVN